MRGPASQGKRVHFREGRKNVLRFLQKIVLERPETRRAAVKPKQTRAVRWAAVPARSSVRANEEKWDCGDQYWQSRRCCRNVFEDRSQDIRRCGLLLNGSGLPTHQHGCDQRDSMNNIFRQDLCNRLGSVDLVLWRDLNEFIVTGGQFV
jgi:hypothetical protein